MDFTKILQEGLDRVRNQPNLPHITAAGLSGVILLLWYIRRRQRRYKKTKSKIQLEMSIALRKKLEEAKKKKVAVDGVFLQRLLALLRIVLPGVYSKQFAILLLHTFFLVARTLASIYVATLDGQIVKAIVEKDGKTFVWLMLKWLLIAMPATYINSMIRYLESKLSISFRSRLVQHVYDLYMSKETYYRIGNLDSRLKNPDQCLTSDVSEWCGELAHIYSQISKPILDVVLMTIQLIVMTKQRHGAGSGTTTLVPTLMAGVVVGATGMILKMVTPPFGRLVAEEARRYGELRAAHSRIITHAEEIAFYGGHKLEKKILEKTYRDHVTYQNKIYKERIFYTMMEQFLMKYCWGACGLMMIAWPVFFPPPNSPHNTSSLSSKSRNELTSSERTQDFVTARGLLISAADAVERLMSSWKEITELAGRTARVSELVQIFEEVRDGHYHKTKEQKPEQEEGDALEHHPEEKKDPKPLPEFGVGTIIDNQELVSLSKVPVVTPCNDVLVTHPGLTFNIEPGMHVLITGPNGCGKSSLFRIIGGLWPIRGGVLRKPARGEMFYIPQRPYLTTGSLREQIIYPDTEQDFNTKGHTDEELYNILAIVNLQTVADMQGGLAKKNEWQDVLSGGEKQRVGMARVFYHKPRYAILDECTSAVSIDVEGRMYTHAKELGITLITVTHRPTLWKYHTHLLQFDGQGGWKFEQLNASTRLSLQEEKIKLESQLAGLPGMQTRLRELCDLLGEKSIYQNSKTPTKHADIVSSSSSSSSSSSDSSDSSTS